MTFRPGLSTHTIVPLRREKPYKASAECLKKHAPSTKLSTCLLRLPRPLEPKPLKQFMLNEGPMRELRTMSAVRVLRRALTLLNPLSDQGSRKLRTVHRPTLGLRA